MGIYEDLGVKPIINALGNATVRGGSIMPPEVVRAMEEAGRTHVRLPELLEKAGARVADLAGVEAAFITSGAAAGIAVAVAGCMTGADLEKMERLPDDTDGMPDEVIVQTRQCYGYDNMIRLAGARTVRAGDENGTTREQVEAAITGRDGRDALLRRLLHAGRPHRRGDGRDRAQPLHSGSSRRRRRRVRLLLRPARVLRHGRRPVHLQRGQGGSAAHNRPVWSSAAGS